MPFIRKALLLVVLNFFHQAEAQIIYDTTEHQTLDVEMDNNTPEYVYKIVSLEQWEESLLNDQLVISAMDADFIHLSKEDQVARVTKKFWNGMDYVVLKLATNSLVGSLVYERNPGGVDKYYHLYSGYIPLASVVEAQIHKNTP